MDLKTAKIIIAKGTFGLLPSIARQNDFIGILLNVVPLAAIAGLCFYLDRKMFPHFKPGKMKKDNNGNYVLG